MQIFMIVNKFNQIVVMNFDSVISGNFNHREIFLLYDKSEVISTKSGNLCCLMN